ncbi:MAG: hypothetical protein KF878_16695 [Planctomycetes bacterium]|nr:hypothetical protein [Planctomycetota bacterium]MCW8139502.1 hypothetical protein [Planctomycetota bacterium]
MGHIEIRFRMNMATGKKDIFIDLETDEDAMRHEHERDHRKIVERLIGQGLIEAEEVGEVKVERAAPGQPLEQPREAPPERAPEAQQGGG